MFKDLEMDRLFSITWVTQFNHKYSYRREARGMESEKDVNMEPQIEEMLFEGEWGHEPGMLVASLEAGKGKDIGSLLKSTKGIEPCQHLDI